MTVTELIEIITGFIGSFGFAILFNIRGKRLIAAAFGGFLSWTLFVLLKFVTDSTAIRYFIVAALISVYAEIMARVLKTPTTTFHMTGLVPLIPGASLYYTMSSAFEGNVDVFSSKAIHTLELSAALALGIVITSALTKIIFNTTSYIKTKNRK